MSRKWSSIIGEERNRLSQAFQNLTDLDQLVMSLDSDELETKRVTISDLMQFIIDPDFENSRVVSEELLTDLNLRRDFNVLLAQMSVCHMPAVAAADSGEILDRTTGPFTVKIRPSSRGNTEVYLLVEGKNHRKGNFKSRLIVRSEDGQVLSEVMPPADNGVSQKLIPKDSDLVRALANVATTIDIL